VPLPPPRERNVLIQVFIVDQLAATLLNQRFAGLALNSGDFALASVIRVFGPITPTELSGMLGIAPTTLSSRLQRLEERREIRRRRNPRDGRSYLIEVTALGRRRVEACFPAFSGTLASIREQLGEDRLGQVLDALAQLETALREAMAEARAARAEAS
jgi:DNA-binding MarR family transcriptional regulator